MQHTNDFFDIENLDLLTPEESKFNKDYIKKLQGYCDGTVDGVQIRNLTSGAATIAKRQQTRSAVAMLKWSMEQKQHISTQAMITDKI